MMNATSSNGLSFMLVGYLLHSGPGVPVVQPCLHFWSHVVQPFRLFHRGTKLHVIAAFVPTPPRHRLLAYFDHDWRAFTRIIHINLFCIQEDANVVRSFNCQLLGLGVDFAVNPWAVHGLSSVSFSARAMTDRLPPTMAAPTVVTTRAKTNAPICVNSFIVRDGSE